MNPSFVTYNSKLVKCLFFFKFSKHQRNCSAFWTLVSESQHEVEPGCPKLAYWGCNLSNQSQILPDTVASWSCFSHPAADVTFEDRALPKNLSNRTSGYPKPMPCRMHHEQDGHSGPLLVFCHVDHGFPGLSSALWTDCPTRHHSHTCRAMWLHCSLPIMVDKMNVFSET